MISEVAIATEEDALLRDHRDSSADCYPDISLELFRRPVPGRRNPVVGVISIIPCC